MALKALRECKVNGCHELTRSTYCDRHKDHNRHKVYDRVQRDPVTDRFYHTMAWKRARLQAMKLAHGLCQDCLKSGRMTSAEMVHHIKGLRKYPELGLVISNLKPLCNRCHGMYKD